jgi:hypothetical protein
VPHTPHSGQGRYKSADFGYDHSHDNDDDDNIKGHSIYSACDGKEVDDGRPFVSRYLVGYEIRGYTTLRASVPPLELTRRPLGISVLLSVGLINASLFQAYWHLCPSFSFLSVINHGMHMAIVGAALWVALWAALGCAEQRDRADLQTNIMNQSYIQLVRVRSLGSVFIPIGHPPSSLLVR